MANVKLKEISWVKIAMACTAYLIVSGDVSCALQPIPSQTRKCILSPSSRITPITRVRKEDGRNAAVRGKQKEDNGTQSSQTASRPPATEKTLPEDPPSVKD